MQDSAPISVLSSEAPPHHAMPDAKAIPLPLTLADATAQEASGVPAPSDTRASIVISAQSTDEQLVLALRKGSEEAFTLLFHRYKQPMFGFFSRRLADSARAEELTQETFVALFRAAKRYEPRASFRSYLYAIAFRILRTDRRKTIFRAAFLGSTKAAASVAVASHTEDSLWVRRGLAKLDATDREIVMLREYQQLTYDEIAALLEIPLSTVRSRLFRARAALRDLLVPPTTQPDQQPATQTLPERQALSSKELGSARVSDPGTSAKKGDRR